MKLKFLKIINFRCINNLCINISNKNSIFIGFNGTGKTSILDVIEILISSLIQTITQSKKNNINKTNISSGTENCILHAIIDFDLFNVEWEISIHKNRKIKKRSIGPDKLRDIFDLHKSFSVPVIAHYSSSNIFNKSYFKSISNNNKLFISDIISNFFINFVGINKTLYIEKVSEGERRLIYILSDLIQKLLLANPHLNNPLSGKGIVLIDGIDLYLHPRLQGYFIKFLEQFFPSIQFIFSTYSPVVLSEGRNFVTYLLEQKEGKTELKKLPYLYGKDINYILCNYMETPEREIMTKRKISNLFNAISTENWSEVDMLKKDLENQLGINEPELIKADVLIKRRKSINK